MAKPFIDPESTYGKLVAALAAHYSPDQLRAMTEAVETAIDDSYEWSKHSDPDDDRRDEEGRNLSKLSYLLFDARALQHARQVEEGEQAMTDDIVARLRAWIPCYRADTDIAVDMAAAADEIERLRRIYSEAEKDHTEYVAKYYNATIEIERLRAERDEVRQSYCSLMEAYRGGDGRVTANKLGWGYLFPRRPKKEDGK